MKYFLFFIAVIATSSASAQVETRLHHAPSGKYTIVQRGPLYESQGWVWSFKDNLSERETVLWKSVRPVEIHWSDDEQWLALEDPLMRLSSVVLAFHLNQGSANLVYQSPYSESNYALFFQFENWTSKDSHFGFIQSISEEHSDHVALKHFISLSPNMRSIVATSYDTSGGDYGAPGKDKNGGALTSGAALGGNGRKVILPTDIEDIHLQHIRDARSDLRARCLEWMQDSQHKQRSPLPNWIKLIELGGLEENTIELEDIVELDMAKLMKSETKDDKITAVMEFPKNSISSLSALPPLWLEQKYGDSIAKIRSLSWKLRMEFNSKNHRLESWQLCFD